MIATVGLVFGFRTSTNLAAAYGIAVTTTMVITTLLAYVVARERWGWRAWRAGTITAAFLIIDLAFFGANLIKIEYGGWFPLVVAAGIYIIMATWHRGRQLVAQRLRESEMPLDVFFNELALRPPLRVPGTAVFMTARAQGAPPILVHHLKHNKALHQCVVLLTVSIVDTPTAAESDRLEVCPLESGFYRVIARYGFMETPNVPAALESAQLREVDSCGDDVTYYLADLTLFATDRLGMARWRENLFIFLARNARRATNFFRIPPDRVVEIGIQLEI
jgi:KUP system potassium uptake protein